MTTHPTYAQFVARGVRIDALMAEGLTGDEAFAKALAEEADAERRFIAHERRGETLAATLPDGYHFRSNAKRYVDGVHVGPGEWLDVIHEANRLAPDTFGAPTSVDAWWAGGTVEEYTDARVLHREDGSLSVVSKTAFGSALLREAVENLGLGGGARFDPARGFASAHDTSATGQRVVCKNTLHQ